MVNLLNGKLGLSQVGSQSVRVLGDLNLSQFVSFCLVYVSNYLCLSLFGFDRVLMWMPQLFWDSSDRSHCGKSANMLVTFQGVMPVWFNDFDISFGWLSSVTRFVVAVSVTCYVVKGTLLQ